MKCDAIIVAAGRGRRMGFDKLMAPLAGKTVLQWSLDAFLACDIIGRIVVVTDENRFARLRNDTSKEVIRVDGGRERFLSVAAGLDVLSGGAPYLAVHDGARPLVMPDQIDACYRAARDHGAATLARRGDVGRQHRVEVDAVDVDLRVAEDTEDVFGVVDGLFDFGVAEQRAQCIDQPVASAADGDFCHVGTPEDHKRREVKLGERDEQNVIVISGLDEGEQIVLNPRTDD